MQLIPNEILTVGIIFVIFVILLTLKIVGIFNIFSWVSEFLDLRKRRTMIEEVKAVERIRKENLRRLSSLIRFRISLLNHNLGILAPSVDLQVIVENYSVFDVILKKFIYQPSLSGIGSLSEYTYDHEIEISQQDSKYFETKFMIPNGVAKHLENCKRQGKEGKHGKIIWTFLFTAYFLGPKGDFKRSRQIVYTKEWYEI